MCLQENGTPKGGETERKLKAKGLREAEGSPNNKYSRWGEMLMIRPRRKTGNRGGDPPWVKEADGTR